MKSLISLLLFVFITYQSMPTIILVLDDNSSFSMFENDQDDEALKNYKELEINVSVFNFFVLISTTEILKSKIISKNQINFDSIPTKIFITPPDIS